MDPTLSVLLLIKNGWSLSSTGLTSSDIVYSTGWYTETLAFPQITVTSQPGGSYLPMEAGPTPLYYFEEIISINIWVRPDSESNKSLGSAKNKEYAMRREVNRILRSGSHISTGSNAEEFLFLRRWRRLDEKDPVILRSMIEITDNYFRSSTENTP